MGNLRTEEDNKLMIDLYGSEAWSSLFEAVEARDQKLAAAGEIHRFNRDVAESLSRIQEKYVAIPEELGRDLNSVLGLIRRHETFETDLVALEAQLQVTWIIIDDQLSFIDVNRYFVGDVPSLTSRS